MENPPFPKLEESPPAEHLPMLAFLMEINRQCSFAKLAVEDFGKERCSKDRPNHRFWYAVQAFLIAAGNVSKLLWPTKKGNAQRGRDLRRLLEVREDSPIAPRSFRNYYEHFDEWLDRWAKDAHSYIDSHIGSRQMFGNPDPSECFRTFDPEQQTLEFQGYSYDLKIILPAIEELHLTTVAVLQNDVIGRHLI